MGRVEHEGNPLGRGFQNFEHFPLTHFPHRNPFYHVGILLRRPCCQLAASVSIVAASRIRGVDPSHSPDIYAAAVS
ncbi:hypothetical protein SJ05684_c28420 [Sinorhizobium sojae CCBAU 05684]|uniref:Uncharacterized protein n=1 Tax=Sinorhizobium sojae CCBAU 05684 TaxID=716928 RepID=A0A249PEA0_9HYPH|nr:hypothetical protein SJ05684_c28420 [Sinorhizobium sojae CCBAU 05684]